MTREIVTENAKIESTMLGFEDHGMMSSFLHLKYDGGGQGFGGYGFDSPVSDNGKFLRRDGVAWGMEYIARVLRVVGVEKWEDLSGKYIRVKHDWNKIYAIGHILEDKWFSPEEDLKYLLPKPEATP